MPNRTIPPPIYPVDNLTFSLPQKFMLDCGIPVYVINMGTQDVLKMDFVCHSGRPAENKPMVARAALTMIKEGTKNHSAAEIAEQLDFYGSNLSFPVNLDTANITLSCLTKYFDKMASLFAELILEPTFPEKELESYKTNSRQRLLVDLAQPDTVAYRTITECLFGSDHPYGYNSSPEGYADLTRADLLDHWKKNVVASRCKIILSGKVGKEQVDILNESLREMPRHEVSPLSIPQVTVSALPQKIHIPQEGSIQTAIRIGRRLSINRKHKDFHALLVLNTVLGGYFGSRLMANIREKKGFTYNIYSTIDCLHEDSYFCIATEVSTDKVEATKKEIYFELQQLIDNEVSPTELEMVRSYMLGNLLTMLDGPFNVASIIKTVVAEELDYGDFGELAKTIKTVSPQQLQALAKQYLSNETLWEVTVGVKEF
ncbi:MAG: M16 family metallopeptidase [Saprospiraceae bacterium]